MNEGLRVLDMDVSNFGLSTSETKLKRWERTLSVYFGGKSMNLPRQNKLRQKEKRFLPLLK